VRVPIVPGLLAAALLAAGGAAAAAGRAPADSATCVALFQRFDVLQWMYPNTRQRYQNRVAPPVAAQAQLVRNAGCLTTTAELAGMEGLAPGTVADAGPAIAPVQLHAGAVTNMQDDARTRAFFEAHGVRARSIGSAPLGRRIYIGPFATQGALDRARDLAVRAGFASPYPADL
jgi:hypothetical protein